MSREEAAQPAPDDGGATIPERHPSLFEPATLLFAVLLALLGVIIGLELITRVGITPNSSIIGAIIAIAASRVPLAVLRPFRSVHRQNLLQTAISGATFGGANAIFLPMGVLWLAGVPELVPVMALGAFLGAVIDAAILYMIFDSRVYPAGGLWPSGIATAECIIAGDQGGRRARLLALGGVAGGLGQYAGIPMDVFGICWIGNIWALAMFGLGLLAGAYAPLVSAMDLTALNAPQGIMIGAGAVAMVQIVTAIRRGGSESAAGRSFGTSGKQLGRGIGGGFVAFAIAAALIALAGGLATDMSFLRLAGFVLFATVAALVSELIVGIAAMHAGWFPAFATALIFLMLGMLLGFPAVPLAFLVGFTASTGPAFADMGYDLKTGWILRGQGARPDFERQGRREQFRAELLGIGVAAVVVLALYGSYFSRDLIPPVDRVYVATIAAGADPGMATALAFWAIPGAIIQLAGGASRQLGILFATGLLIHNPAAGWTALAALLVRAVLERRFGRAVEGPMYVLAGGFIAGSALTSFGSALKR